MDQAVFSGSGFLTTVVLARILGPAEFGVYASVVLISYLIISIMNALVIQPFQVASTEISDQTSYHSFTFWIQLILLFILSILIFIILRYNIKALDSFNQLNEGQIIYYACFIFQDYFRKFFFSQILGIIHPDDRYPDVYFANRFIRPCVLEYRLDIE